MALANKETLDPVVRENALMDSQLAFPVFRVLWQMRQLEVYNIFVRDDGTMGEIWWKEKYRKRKWSEAFTRMSWALSSIKIKHYHIFLGFTLLL